MSSEIVPQNDSRRTNWLVVGLVLVGVVVSLLPIVLHLSAPSNRGAGPVFAYLPAILAAVLCYALDPALAKREKATVLYLCVALAFLTTYLHVWMVDIGPFRGGPNLWQLAMHQAVIDLSPDRLPHSYRFLPNSLVRLFEQVTGDFAVARDSYRNLFGVLIFYSLYRFARFFLSQGAGLFCLALFAAILPAAKVCHAGVYSMGPSRDAGKFRHWHLRQSVESRLERLDPIASSWNRHVHRRVDCCRHSQYLRPLAMSS